MYQNRNSAPIEMQASAAVMIRSRVIFASRLRSTLVSDTVGMGSGSGGASSDAGAPTVASATEVSAAEDFAITTGGSGSESLSTIGNATILALVSLPIRPPY